MSYYFKDDQFIIEDYDKQKTFSSFLPGIAGLKGIPLWTFYANRGQGVTSFGIRDKDEPILEFFPANTSYQYVDKYGFRSFVKVDGQTYEPFSVASPDVVKRTMYISRAYFEIEEVNESRQIAYKVSYFGLPNEPIAGLIRRVTIRNLGEERPIEIIDGLASILPSGATNTSYKEMSNLMRSWMAVENLDKNLPFYKFRASSGDEAEVSMINKGHFYMSFYKESLIKPIVDTGLVFSYDTSLSSPLGLVDKSLNDFDLNNQVVVNKVPCGFTPISDRIGRGKALEFHTIIGHVSDIEIINQTYNNYKSLSVIDDKLSHAKMIIDDLVAGIETETSNPMFDAYLKQSYLDNILRGGYPLVFGKDQNQKVYHVYSRKHGDPERDYNFFKLAPEFYSQGNGNFRDVNQNRRNDVFFVPEAGLYNIKTFMSLIQLDGYNPLSVKGSTFTLTSDDLNLILNHVVEGRKILEDLLVKKFTPGQISMTLMLSDVLLNITEETFISIILQAAEQHIEADFGEGFWIDHWTYNFDLIENYKNIYPDRLEDLLYEDPSYLYFDSHVYVLPRSQKYGLTKGGQVRQFGSIEENQNDLNAKWLTDVDGHVYKTTLIQKLLTLVLTKCSSLDPFGMGIEMEANKPGWNDAMNGLPGVFGSGMGETIELLRLVTFLKAHITRDVDLLDENFVFLQEIYKILKSEKDLFTRWDQLSSARETFRATTRLGVSGQEKRLSKEDLVDFLNVVNHVLLDGINKAKEMNQGIMPTFISYRASKYEELGYLTPYGLEAVRVLEFERQAIPNFLEGPARSLKVKDNDHQKMYESIKKSDLFDRVLKTYKTSEKLDEMSYELGRVRAFTPGWLERESNFLHMTYKYMLGLIKAGLYDSFYTEIKNNLVCFMDPKVYGRSTLENSSFIASSFNPDPQVHGQGFVARLSGSTAEMLSIWHLMMFGKQVFSFDNELSFTPSPVLHGDMFKNGCVKTKFLSEIDFCIENDTGLATYDKRIKVEYYLVDGKRFNEVQGQLAKDIRNKLVKDIVMVYKRK